MMSEHRPAVGLSSVGRHTLCMEDGEPWPCKTADIEHGYITRIEREAADDHYTTYRDGVWAAGSAGAEGEAPSAKERYDAISAANDKWPNSTRHSTTLRRGFIEGYITARAQGVPPQGLDARGAYIALRTLYEAAKAVQPFPVDAPDLPEWSRVRSTRLRDLYDAAHTAQSFLARLTSEATD